MTGLRFLILGLALMAIGIGCGRSSVEEIQVGAQDRSKAAPAFQPNEDDWPGWRGPRNNGHAAPNTAPTNWSETENVLWAAKVPGRGHGSPVVTGDLVVIATADESAETQSVVAFDRTTGEPRWQQQIHEGGFPSGRQMHPKSTHANGTIASDDRSLFIAFLNRQSITLSSIDFSGELQWQTELGEFKSKFGYAPSPVLYEGLVICAADNRGGGYLAAVDRRSGQIVWRKARANNSSYSTAVVAYVAGKDQLLISGNKEVTSYDPATGELLWKCAGTASATCGTIVCNDDFVFASGGYPEKETLAIRADGSAEVVWRDRNSCYEPSMLLVGSELYAVTDSGIAICRDATTGTVQWKKRLGSGFSASPVFANGLVYVLGDDGKTTVFRAQASAFELVSSNPTGDNAYASPAICGDSIYLRVGKQQAGRRQEFLYRIGGN